MNEVEVVDGLEAEDIRRALCQELLIPDRCLPETEEALLSHAFDPTVPRRQMWLIIGRCTHDMVKRQAEIAGEFVAVVADILVCLLSLPNIAPETDRRMRIRDAMRSILGESTQKKPYAYPGLFQRAAAHILDTLNAQIVEVDEETVASSINNEVQSRKKQRKSRDGTPRRDHARVTDGMVTEALRGILVAKTGVRSYKLDHKPEQRRSCNAFGHNGLLVGQWWPLRICALRDGAHGSTMGGIAGSAASGAFSIVVSGSYEELNNDLGNTLYYAGSNSEANTDPDNPVITYATQALRTSFYHRRRVRVLRTANNGSKLAPSKGIRYDGLYIIDAEQICINGNGGAYMRFKMTRELDQPDIDTSRPTLAERRIFDAIKEL